MRPFKPYPCPDCGRKPGLWEVSFYGYSLPKFKVECPHCGKKTEFYAKSSAAAMAWDKGCYAEPHPERRNFDNEGVTELMGCVMAELNSDYQRIAGRERLTNWDIAQMKDLEDFVMDNPYMLPYDRNYVLEEMRRIAEKTRKMHAS